MISESSSQLVAGRYFCREGLVIEEFAVRGGEFMDGIGGNGRCIEGLVTEEFAMREGEFMDGIGVNGSYNASDVEVEEEEHGEEAVAKEEAQDEGRVLAGAQELESAVAALLQREGVVDPAKQMVANEWIAQFVTKPNAWTGALYVAFPPADSGVGTSIDVRYFTLNILLGKIRSDWIQLGSEDALDLYQTLLGQLPYNLENPWFASRLVVLVAAAAAVVGGQAAQQLVRQALDVKPIVEGPLVYEVLTAVAEEVFLRSRTHSEEVAACMRDISPEVVQFLDDNVNGIADASQESKILVCLERWINAGFTLSELYSTYPNLLEALYRALGSQNDRCFEAAVSCLTEFIAAVDGLPEREVAVRATVSAILAQRVLYTAAAAASPGEVGFQYLKGRSRGLVALVSVLASSEASLLARGGEEASNLLDWLVDASGGGGGLSLEGATVSAVAWPHLVAVAAIRSSESLQASRFAAAAQAVLRAEKYPADSEDWDESGWEYELLEYRDGTAADALASFFEQLGFPFLSQILAELQQALSWQSAEVCLFAVASLSTEIKAFAGLSVLQAKKTSSEGEQISARSFLSAVFVWISASSPSSGQELTREQSWRLVQTILLVVEEYAEWTAIDLKALEAGMQYALSALKLSKVRDCAATALGGLCRAAAPHIVSTPALTLVFSAYEVALSTSGGLAGDARLGFVEGLAVIASFLPTADAETVLKSISSTAVSTVKSIAEMGARADVNVQVLAEELRVLAAVVSYGSQKDGNPALHPALPILHEIWPALDVAAGYWAGDASVVTALCELWGTIATRLGMVLTAVLPSVIRSSTAMYKQHLVPACLDCLSKIVLLGSRNTNIISEVEEILGETLVEVAGTIDSLEEIVKDARSKRGPGHNTPARRQEGDPEDDQNQNAEACLCLISTLGRSFLHKKPYIFLASATFLKIIYFTIGTIHRTEVESALASAKLLSETILCLSFSENDFKGMVVWQLPADLVPRVDAMVALYGAPIVKTVLQTLARLQLLDYLVEALADVLYGLCMRYSTDTKVAMEVTLNAKDFPARKGVLNENDKVSFVAAATAHPVQPRRRFQELINIFSQVCRGRVPAEALTGF